MNCFTASGHLARAMFVWCAWTTLTAMAQTNTPILRETDHAALVQALDVLNLTTNDPGFRKDVAEPRWALQRVRDALADPLEVPRWGDDVAQVARDGEARATFAAVARWLELPAPAPVLVVPVAGNSDDAGTKLDPRLREALAAFAHAGLRARVQVEHALVNVSFADRVYAAASLLAGSLLVDDHPERRPLLVAAGMPPDVIDAVIAAERELDPEPDASRTLAAALDLKLENLVAAASDLRGALADLETRCAGVDWPTSVVRVTISGMDIVVGTTGADRFDTAVTLILDPAGDDLYTGGAGQANGLLARPLSVILDLGGHDRYEGAEVLGPGAALFGVALLVDCAGADTHRADYVGAGAGLFGGAHVEDTAGDDTYRAHLLGQGAGIAGFGVLRDASGNDRYDLGFCGQGYAGLRGVGLLIDAAGNDRYAAGGVRVDYDRNEGRYLSLAQGFATGMRPYAGGGVAALVDLAGNDAYEADVYGQGVGYWYAVGMLIDGAGEDTYQLFQYGQGAGIHLSLGLLADLGGRDLYTGYILCQGNAHDYAVGWLIDHDGDDTYTGDHAVQGRAINNSLAILLDAGGNDAYLARQPEQAQGIGDNGADREYGSLALLLDLAGTDRYTSGATNGIVTERPDFGVIFDVPPPRGGVAP